VSFVRQSYLRLQTDERGRCRFGLVVEGAEPLTQHDNDTKFSNYELVIRPLSSDRRCEPGCDHRFELHERHLRIGDSNSRPNSTAGCVQCWRVLWGDDGSEQVLVPSATEHLRWFRSVCHLRCDHQLEVRKSRRRDPPGQQPPTGALHRRPAFRRIHFRGAVDVSIDGLLHNDLVELKLIQEEELKRIEEQAQVSAETINPYYNLDEPPTPATGVTTLTGGTPRAPEIPLTTLELQPRKGTETVTKRATKTLTATEKSKLCDFFKYFTIYNMSMPEGIKYVGSISAWGPCSVYNKNITVWKSTQIHKGWFVAALLIPGFISCVVIGVFLLVCLLAAFIAFILIFIIVFPILACIYRTCDTFEIKDAIVVSNLWKELTSIWFICKRDANLSKDIRIEYLKHHNSFWIA